ncbi:tRNA lysidine(34) synthetase TilS [Lachnospiraceae bacterium OttesenSCG-928-E19]|nr:tRNA lysidine(34) synthetase TilS [Lachnospiraceae bacterium OttesenSCG-928-E19]
MNQNFIDFMEKYAGQKIAIAISGGVDSVALLYWMREIGVDIVALHVNHGLRDVADVEAEYVHDLCKKLKIPCEILCWDGEKPVTGLESAARDARYKLMTDYCANNGIEYLAVAHQADDQIETFLMNLSRGSGLYGLSAMRGESERDGVKIIRPLLNVFRAELEKYCADNNIKYYIDEMNDDEKYTRVRIRKNRHLMYDKLGISDERILLAIKNLSRTRDAMDEYIADRIKLVRKKDYARFKASFLFDEPMDIRLRLIGTLITEIGGNPYGPRLNSLENALDSLGDNSKLTLGHCILRRLGDDILIVPTGSSASFRKRKEIINENAK